MAISTYAELQTAVASWLHRDVSQITDFITLAEKRINSLLDSRIAEVDQTLTATISSRYIALPSGYMRSLGLWLTTYDPRKEVRYEIPENMRVSAATGQPFYYTIDGSNIAFDCPADQAYTYTLRYKKGYDIASTSTNDILTNYPSLYLYGALADSCMLTREDPATFEQRFQVALEEALRTESKNKAHATIQSDMVSRDRVNIITGDY